MTQHAAALPEVDDIYELSPLQQGMLFHTLFAPRAGLYFEQEVFRLTSAVNVTAFERAWKQVVDRHTALRVSVYWEDLEKPLQVVHRRVKLPLAYRDWRYLSPPQQSTQLEEFLRADRDRGFDLTQPPLMRLALIQLADGVYDLIWSFHHLLLDGWSGHVVLQEVSALYRAGCLGQETHLPPARPYAEYIAWLQLQDMAQAEAYWRDLLQGFASPTALPFDRTRHAVNGASLAFAEHEAKVTPDDTAALKELGRVRHLTLNTLVQGAWALLLSRYCGLDDVVFGSVVSGRPTELDGVESTVGLFINTLPVRARIGPGLSVHAWLHELQAQQLASRMFEYSPLVHVQRWSEVPRGVQLFDSLLIFENFPTGGSGSNDSEPDNAVRYIGRTNYALSMQAIPGPSLRLRLVYDARLFERTTVERLTNQFKTILSSIVASTDAAVADIAIVDDADRAYVVEQLNDTRAEFPADDTVHQLFETQAELTPDATALIAGGDQQLTYRRLNERANQVAHYLRRRGVGPETLVGVCLERTPELLVALLGILKAGAAYVPLDASYPRDRLAFMLDDASASIVLTQHRLRGQLPTDPAQLVCLDTAHSDLDAESTANPISGVRGDNLAYVIYTSGSTGRPKGVAGTHRATVNRLTWMWRRYPFEPTDIACQKTSLSFVDSIWEIFGPLLSGIPTVLVDTRTVQDVERFIDELHHHQVTRIVLVPSLLRALLDSSLDLRERLPALRCWISSGEVLSTELLQRFHRAAPHATLLNLYGSSEVAADATWYETRPDAALARVPVGRPIANTQVYVLDQHLNPVPVGVVGEIYVGGVGLARGYYNQPALTAERFLPNRFDPQSGGRYFRTGDLGRWAAAGTLEYLGRIDNQVKLRGHRIELGEIESTLLEHPDLAQAVVAAYIDPPTYGRLVAYAVARNGQRLAIDQLRQFLRLKLPEFMVPSEFVQLESLPLTPSGKIDRLALRNSEGAVDSAPRVEYAAPRTPVEERLAALFADVLHLQRVSIYDNFFTVLGGHSLLATQLVSRIRDALQFELALDRFFDVATVVGLAELVEVQRHEPATSTTPVAPIRRATQPLSVDDLAHLSDAEVDALLKEAMAREPRA